MYRKYEIVEDFIVILSTLIIHYSKRKVYFKNDTCFRT